MAARNDIFNLKKEEIQCEVCRAYFPKSRGHTCPGWMKILVQSKKYKNQSKEDITPPPEWDISSTNEDSI